MRQVRFVAGGCFVAAVSLTAAADIKVGVVGGGQMTAAQAAAQLNDDTWFDFTASVTSASGADTLAELMAYDVVVLGDAGFRDNGYTAQMFAAMRQYLDAGGGIVTVGWYNFATDTYGGQQALDADYITPIADGQYNFQGSGGQIVVTNSGHPITTGINTFGYSGNNLEFETAIDGGAVSLGHGDGGTTNYAIVYQDGTTGNSVYLGGLYLASTSYNNGGLRSGVEDRLFEQAVAWAGKIPGPGALAVFGLAGFVGRSRRRD